MCGLLQFVKLHEIRVPAADRCKHGLIEKAFPIHRIVFLKVRFSWKVWPISDHSVMVRTETVHRLHQTEKDRQSNLPSFFLEIAYMDPFVKSTRTFFSPFEPMYKVLKHCSQFTDLNSLPF